MERWRGGLKHFVKLFFLDAEKPVVLGWLPDVHVLVFQLEDLKKKNTKKEPPGLNHDKR